MEKSMLTEEIKEKWGPIIDAEGIAPITDRTLRNNTIRVLENTIQEASSNTGSIGNISSVSDNNGTGAGYDPVLISMVRRAMPVLVANDIMGVQPMSGPTGLIFAMNSKRHVNPADALAGTFTDAWGTSGYSPNSAANIALNKDATADGEVLGANKVVSGVSDVIQETPWREATFDISKTSVTAQTRAMKASYTTELAQDLKAVHGIDAETELASLLSSEIVTEINREMVNLVNTKAVVGAQQTGIATPGEFDLLADTDARWSIEAYKGLYFQIEREANLIGQQTGRGRGNILIVSADVASALEAAVKLDTAPLAGNIVGGWTGISYAGVLMGKYKVFIDPYAPSDYITVGYKGANTYDAGLSYCPYVPLQMMKAIGEDSFQPRLGFKTRYGLVANPFVDITTNTDGTGTNGGNQYYRSFAVKNLAVGSAI